MQKGNYLELRHAYRYPKTSSTLAHCIIRVYNHKYNITKHAHHFKNFKHAVNSPSKKLLLFGPNNLVTFSAQRHFSWSDMVKVSPTPIQMTLCQHEQQVTLQYSKKANISYHVQSNTLCKIQCNKNDYENKFVPIISINLHNNATVQLGVGQHLVQAVIYITLSLARY